MMHSPRRWFPSPTHTVVFLLSVVAFAACCGCSDMMCPAKTATDSGKPAAGAAAVAGEQSAEPDDKPLDVPIVIDAQAPDTAGAAPANATASSESAPTNAAAPPEDDPADLAALKKLGVEYDTNGDEQVIEINFKKKKASAEALKLAGRFASLEILNLDKTGVTDKQLAYVKGLTGLRELSLEENPITDDGLPHLAGLKKLEVLSLVKTKITGAGLKHLQKLSGLTVLNLSHCNVKDSALGHLTAYPKLETLALQATKVNGSGFVHLAKLKNLITLNLDDVTIKGRSAMLNFKDLPKIRIIYMRNSKVSKRSIDKLTDANPSLAVFQ